MKTKTAKIYISFILVQVILLFCVPEQGASENPHVHTIIVDNYYPYTFVNQYGKPDGFSVDLMNSVIKVMDIELIIEVKNWELALKSLENGEIDFLPMMAYSSEREVLFDFSPAHTVAYDAIFTRTDDVRLQKLSELSNKSVIVLKDDIAHQYLQSALKLPAEKILLVNTTADGLRKLASGEGDALLMPKLTGLLMIKSLKLSNISPTPRIIELYTRNFSFAVKDGNKPLLEKLNQGLLIINKTGEYKAIYDKWFGEVDTQWISYPKALKYIIWAFAGFIAVGIIIFIWSLSLKKQVAARTAELNSEINIRKENENEINELLQQKKILLLEVHHRIKNNMNTIMSLLHLQSKTLKDPSAVTALLDARSRVQSMMVLYDTLYRKNSTGEISLKDYLSSLVDKIIVNFPNSAIVRTEKHIGDYILDHKVLSPLGIIINEVITNAMKYAFAGRNDGLLTISASVTESRAEIIIGDNGIGIPEAINFDTSSGFGLKLIGLMARQINGTAKIVRETGTRFVIEFEV